MNARQSRTKLIRSVCFALGVSLLLPIHVRPDTLAVPGIDFAESLFPGDYRHPDHNPEYLADKIRSYFTRFPAFKENEPVAPFLGWYDRDIAGTKNAVRALKKAIQDGYAAAVFNKRSFNVVAHSWGGVLAYLALQELASEGKNIEVDNFFTLGTPVGMIPQCGKAESLRAGDRNLPIIKSVVCNHVPQSLRGKPIGRPRGVKNWVNYYSDGDPVSTKILGVAQNENVGKFGFGILGSRDTATGVILNHSQYYEWEESPDLLGIHGVDRRGFVAEKVLADVAVAIVKSNRQKRDEATRTANIRQESAKAAKCPEPKPKETTGSPIYQEWKQWLGKHFPGAKTPGC